MSFSSDLIVNRSFIDEKIEWKMENASRGVNFVDDSREFRDFVICFCSIDQFFFICKPWISVPRD